MKGPPVKEKIRTHVEQLFMKLPPQEIQSIAEGFRAIWLDFEPKSIGGIKAEDRQKQENVGAPVEVLRSIGAAAGKYTSQDVGGFLPLTELLWNEFGREGRIVASAALGKMELKNPRRVLPKIKSLCRSCITWEDCDVLAMRALEPIVRKDPEIWLPEMKSWLEDKNKWIQRAGATVIGRLPMKRSDLTETCLKMLPPFLNSPERDVQRAVSFAIRLAARGEIKPVIAFLDCQVPPGDPAATWVLCDVIRSMTKRFLPEFKSLLPKYQAWAADPALNPKDLRSIESTIKFLKNA